VTPPAAPSAPRTLLRAHWTVAPQLIDCMGLIRQRCLQYRDSPSGPWKAHHGPIEGFVFEPDTEVDMEIKMVEEPKPVADGAWLRVVMVQELARRSVKEVPMKPLAGSQWQLQSLTGMDHLPNPDRAIDLAFGVEPDLRLSGFAGVNRYLGSAQAGPDGALSIGPVASTRMAGEPSATALERYFLQQLEQTRSYRMEGPRLSFFSQTGQLLMLWRQR
jgi:heat shock protein HslJ